MQAAAAAAPAATSQRLISSADLPHGWQPLSLLASGAVNRVWLAQAPNGWRLAVKGLQTSLIDHAGARYLLGRERRLLACLQGPGVVALGCESAGYIAMEYLAGGDLLSLAGGPAGSWLRPMAALARALQRIHSLGWIHRDVRPENALFRSAHTPVWIDFQAAAELSGDAAGLSPGSTPYASPQQRAGLPPDFRDDVFSFAVMLYQLATGALPAPAPAGSAVRQLPLAGAPALGEWTAAALAPEPSARPAGMGGLAEILEAMIERNDGDD